MQIKHKFRELTPIRAYSGTVFSDYRRYKKHLRLDFNGKCGYTDSSDSWFGGVRCFHIDHFKPKKKYPALETLYSNLVYSCSYVNEKKSDEDDEFLDPCTSDYNEHFFRDAEGNICANPESPSATYMCNKLCLNLRRYGLIWQLEQARKKITELSLLLDRVVVDTPEETLLLRESRAIESLFHTYLRYLGAEL